MDLAARKYNFIQELTKVDESILLQLENVLKKSKKNQDWYENLDAEEKNEIQIGINQADESDLIGNDEVMNKFSKWH